MRRLKFSEGEYYHVYSRGVEKRKIFLDDSDYKRFVALLYTANSDTPIHLSNYQGKALPDIPRGEFVTALGAWCLMSNHFHLLMKETHPNGISTFMQKLLTGYSMYFNKKYQRTGSLFERKFSAKHLDSDQYLKYQYAYIHLNPIGIIDKGWKNKHLTNKKAAKNFIEVYRYSSYPDFLGKSREESVILERASFPTYFEFMHDFTSMINEWIQYDIKARP